MALRHQLSVLRRKLTKRHAFSNFDRLIFAGLYRIAPDVLNAVLIARPESSDTLISAALWLADSQARPTPNVMVGRDGGIDTLTTITCQCRWAAHSRSLQNQSLAIVSANPKRLRERLYWVNVSMPAVIMPEIDSDNGEGPVPLARL